MSAPVSAPVIELARADPLSLQHNLEWTERESVRRALDAAGGVTKDAAEILGISQRALSYYLAKRRVL